MQLPAGIAVAAVAGTGLAVFATDAGPLSAGAPSPVELGAERAAQAKPAFPDRRRVRSARRHADRRAGLVSFAVIDTHGRLTGLRTRRRYKSASTVKTMLAIAYLRKLSREHRRLDGRGRGLLGPMITRSDNDSASAVYGIVGPGGLSAVARAAHMKDFRNAPFGAWGGTLVTAGDLARLFLHLDGLVPRGYRGYMRKLLSSIVRSQRWGIPAGVRDGWTVFFKGGWRRGSSGRIVHQAARLERAGEVVAMAVLTDGNPSHGYGTRTVRGVATHLMRPRRAAPASPAAGPLRRAGLISLRSLSPGLRLDLRYATRRNFTGRRLPGYCKPIAVMRVPAARAVAKVEQRLAADGLGLKIYDAYRPARATRAMVRWAERTGRQELLDQGYIARRSNHNRGAAVDLTLVRASDGAELDMGTPYDSFSTHSHTQNASGRALRNRLRLKHAMESAGFRNYRREWWHYDHPSAGPALDVPLGC